MILKNDILQARIEPSQGTGETIWAYVDKVGNIYFSEGLLKKALLENEDFQAIKAYENEGCGNPKKAFIGSLLEMCVELALLDSEWERSEFVNRNTQEPDFINMNDGMTIEVRATRVPNALYLKPKDVRDILNHETKGKASDVYLGYTTSWDGRMNEMRTLKEMFANDERPHFKLQGFTTRGLLANMIRNYKRAEIGDCPKPIAPKPLATLLMQYMKIHDASNPKYPSTKGRMLVEMCSLFGWNVLEKFLKHEVITGDKWERAIHLLD